MSLILKIAWRNIQRHRGKSIVIGIILFLGAFIMTVGNGVMSGMDKGLNESIVNRFTGHIVVVSKNQESNTVILVPLGGNVQVITGYPVIKQILDKQTYIDKYLPVCRGITMILNNEGDIGFALLLGVNFEEYQKMFKNNIKLIEGEFLKKGDRGILVTNGNRKSIYNDQNFWVKPVGYPFIEANLSDVAKENKATLDVRDNLILMGASQENTTSDIRLDIKGIVDFELLSDYWWYFNISDTESFREAFNYVTSSDAAVEVSQEKKNLLAKENLDNIFDDNLVQKPETLTQNYNIANFMGKKLVRKSIDIDTGAYTLIFIKVKDDRHIGRYVDKLNDEFKKQNAPARAITWKQAIGQVNDSALLIRTALFGFVFIIFFVAIIIIMNTLSMAAMERVSEIGMMRAVGARRTFVAGMFFMETSFLSAIFGGAGIIAGIIMVHILNLLNITTSNMILQLLFGGNVFRPVLDFWDILLGIVELIVVTVIAALYPIQVARKITPLEAIARD